VATFSELVDKKNTKWIDKFGRDFTWTPQGGDPTTVKGILNYNYLDTTGGIGVQTYDADVTVEAADVPGIDTGDGWADGAQNFVISKLEPDEEGLIEVILMKVA
jgi:hypothetical protein